MHKCLLLALAGPVAWTRYRVHTNLMRNIPGKQSLGRRRGKIHKKEKY